MTVKTPIGEITANERTLNMLLQYAFEYSEINADKGYKCLAEEAADTVCEIHKALSESGYYDDARK